MGESMSASLSEMTYDNMAFDQGTVVSSDDTKTDPAVWDMIVVGAGVAGATLAATQGKVRETEVLVSTFAKAVYVRAARPTGAAAGTRFGPAEPHRRGVAAARRTRQTQSPWPRGCRRGDRCAKSEVPSSIWLHESVT